MRLFTLSAAITGMLLAAACGNNTTPQPNAGNDTVAVKDSLVKDTTGADTTGLRLAGDPFAASGVLSNITNGKDGFMATLTTANGTAYSTVFSIIKLEKNYKRLKEGDRVQVSGDTMQLGNMLHIQVRHFSLQ